MKTKIRVRFAPSPTGPIHIGGLRTALYNYLFAKKHNGSFILRIDDTDINRNKNKAIKYILKTLKWLNLNYHKNKYYLQSSRLKIYKKYLRYLIKKKYAYYAFESKGDLKLYKKKNKNFVYNYLTRNNLKNSLTLNKKIVKKYISRKKYVVRLKIPLKKNIIFKDKIYGIIKINTKEIDDKIIFRSNNTPTYYLAGAIDDHLMKITHIIRGKEWISSTPIHIILYKYFNWDLPIFIHLPLLLNNKNGKISKRLLNDNNFPIYPLNDTNFSITSSYRENGFFKKAFIFILASLGFTEIDYNNFSIKKLINSFNLNKIKKSDIRLNYKKFCFINKQYINNTHNNKYVNKKLLNYLSNFINKKNIKRKYLNNIINLNKNRISLINDIWEESKYFFINPKKFDIPKNIYKYIKNNRPNIIYFFNKCLNYIKKNKVTNEKISVLIKNTDINLIKLLRISIVGKLSGISIINILYIMYKINKNNLIYRIENFIKFIYQHKI